MIARHSASRYQSAPTCVLTKAKEGILPDAEALMLYSERCFCCQYERIVSDLAGRAVISLTLRRLKFAVSCFLQAGQVEQAGQK
jgi:hypothetical protein